MSSRQKLIQGRTKLNIPNLTTAVVTVAKRASWGRVLGALGVFAVCILMISFFVARAVLKKPATTPLSETPKTTIDQSRDPLTGEKVDAPLESLPQALSVMVENSYEAWPLSGINDAFLVIEAPVEGAIPRFITFFEEGDTAGKIGPVRSARPYYLDWADELQALYAHVGGSPEALDLIRTNGTTQDLNEFSQGEYFWRDSVRSAPHNAYTSTALLKSALDEVGRKTLSYGAWLFKDDSPVEGDTISPTIDWASGNVYDVTWRYDAGANHYRRLQGAQFALTTSGESIYANNVVVMEATVTVVDEVGRRHIETVGSGAARVFQDGKEIVGTWKKVSRTDRLRFYDASGQEIMMNAGKTWIEVVPDITAVGHEAN